MAGQHHQGQGVVGGEDGAVDAVTGGCGAGEECVARSHGGSCGQVGHHVTAGYQHAVGRGVVSRGHGGVAHGLVQGDDHEGNLGTRELTVLIQIHLHTYVAKEIVCQQFLYLVFFARIRIIGSIQ